MSTVAVIVLSRLRPRLSYANVGVTVLLVLAGGGWALAAIPDRSGVIHGCLNKRTAGGTGIPGSSSVSPATGISISVSCTNTPSDGNKLTVSNSSGSNLELFIDDSRNLTPTPCTAALASG